MREETQRSCAECSRNILLISIDKLRADALSAYGGPARTPNLDRLAAEGVRFSFAHAHAVVTLPSHASILTGRFPAWIRAQPTRWFAWVHVYEPHAPYKPPPPFDREYATQPYYGEVAATDAALGPLLDAVRTLARPTLVIATGDHGEALGEHGEATHGLFAYEPTLKVPLIIAELAGEVDRRISGEIASTPAFHVDIMPTILDAVGAAIPSDLPGRSLRTAAARNDSTPRASYFEAMSPSVEYGWAPLSGLLLSAEKYIDLSLAELYDLGRDPHEADNVAARSAERARALSARLAAFQAPRPTMPQAEAADAAARLRALGYVTASAAPKVTYTEADDPKRLVDLDRRMQEAAVLDAAGRIQDAIPLYRAILARRPDMIATARHLAFDYWRVGDADAAIKTLQAGLRAAGHSPGTEVELGSYLLESGRPTEAIALLADAAASERSFDALSALGLAYARAGRSADALDTLRQTIELDPANAIAYENIGAVQLDAGHIADAKRTFERAVALNRDSSQRENGLALIAMRSGDRAAAIAHWRRAVEIQPANFDALYDLGIQLARDGRRDEAQRYLNQFATTAPPAQYAKELREAGSLLKDLSTQSTQR